MTIYACKKHKFIYFSIFKNASSTIRHFILKNLLNEPELKYNWQQIATFSNYSNEIKVIKNKKEIYTTKYYDYFWFIFFRNPYDRVVSVYNDKVLAIPKDQIYEGLYNPKMKLYEFIDFVAGTSDNKIDIHLKSQTIGLKDDLQYMNLIGDIKHLDTHIKYLKNRLNLKYEPIQLRKTKKIELDSYLKKLLYNRYREDFETFKKLGFNYK